MAFAAAVDSRGRARRAARLHCVAAVLAAGPGQTVVPLAAVGRNRAHPGPPRPRCWDAAVAADPGAGLVVGPSRVAPPESGGLPGRVGRRGGPSQDTTQ